MAVVKEMWLGNTHVFIHDDYCKDKTKADVDAILARIAMRAQAALSAAAAARACGETENTPG